MSEPYYSDDFVELWHGDCLDVLPTLPDTSVDSVVTDPPYDLTANKKGGSGAASVNLNTPYGRARIGTGNGAGGFMGKGWDATGIAFDPAVWRECLRVLKPGGHLLAFGGSRTWHRLAVAIEDAGFELRDSIFWIYGQGFPKLMNPARDKAFCHCGKVGYDRDESTESQAEHGVRGVRQPHVPTPVRVAGGAREVLLPSLPEPGAPAPGRTELPAADVWAGESRMEGRSDDPEAEGQLHRAALRPVPREVAEHGAVGRLRDGAQAGCGGVDRTPPAALGSGEPHQPQPEGQPAGEPGALPEQRRPQARRGWPVCARCGKPSASGLGTALKPSAEPVVVARKPLEGTVAANVLTWGTGALNIDATRIPGDEDGSRNRPPSRLGSADTYAQDEWTRTAIVQRQDTTGLGRWPANVVLDEHAAAELDRQSGTLTSGILAAHHQRAPKDAGILGAYGSADGERGYGDTGGASRFFYVAKAPTSERPRVGGIAHPTVKPLDLMRWLVRLVTPPGGTVLEPFAGSGTTAEACVLEGFQCIAIEREADYLPLITSRLDKPVQLGLNFEEPAS